MNITPISGSKPHTDVAADLRALADLAESDAFAAAIVSRLFTEAVWPAHVASYEHVGQHREVIAEAIRRFKPLAAGPVVKEYRHDGRYFHALIPLRALRIDLVDERAQVCERVVTGTEVITEEIPDPDAPTITRTREVEIVEWRCTPVLAPASEAVTA